MSTSEYQNAHAYVIDSAVSESGFKGKRDGIGITVDDTALRPTQNAIAQATIWIPFLGACAAIAHAAVFGIGRTEIILCAAGFFITSLGIEFGLHRAFAHRAFETHRSIKILFAILGSMAAEGRILYWVASHRRHHIYSDTAGDPHSPHVRKKDRRVEELTGWRGLLHAHIGHMVTDGITNCTLFAKDLQSDPAIRRVSDWYGAWVLLGYLIPALVGALVHRTWNGALSGLLWGGFMRMFLVHHTTWSVASFCHRFGAAPFQTNDKSRNNLWFVVPSLGSALQNNHHAFPNSAYLGLKWWEIDITAMVIRLAAAVGLVWNVRRPTPGQVEKLRRTSASNDAARAE